MPGVVALDLETVPLVDSPNLSDPSHWEIFAVALAYRPRPGTNIDVSVKILTEAGLNAEKKLLTEMCGWVELRDPDCIITFNGENYDLPILRERGGGRVESLLNQTTHNDVYRHVKDRARENESCSLDAVLDRHDLQNPGVQFEGEIISGEDMPRFARAIWGDMVGGERKRELLRCVEFYASSDIRPLIELWDRLTHYPGPDSGR